MPHIALCGSMIFEDKMRLVALELESLGFQVIYPKTSDADKEKGMTTFMDHVDALGGLDNVPSNHAIWALKGYEMKAYKSVIDEADAILICNFDKGTQKNRIGENAFLEMGYAFFNDKPIFVLNNPPENDPKIEEILGMTPVFLSGHLEKLKTLIPI